MCAAWTYLRALQHSISSTIDSTAPETTYGNCAKLQTSSPSLRGVCLAARLAAASSSPPSSGCASSAAPACEACGAPTRHAVTLQLLHERRHATPHCSVHPGRHLPMVHHKYDVVHISTSTEQRFATFQHENDETDNQASAPCAARARRPGCIAP